MGAEGIRMRAIYQPVQPLEDDVYAYIRAWQGDEIGFSVLDKVTKHPDFTHCGMFWLKREDFEDVFKINENGGSQYWGSDGQQ